MSMPPATDQGPTLGGPDHSLAAVVGTVRDGIEATSFWAAIVLPFILVPVLVTGPEAPAGAITFLALLGLNVLAIVLGHSYRHEDAG